MNPWDVELSENYIALCSQVIINNNGCIGLMQLLRKYLQTTIKEDVSNLFALSLSRAKGGGEEEG